MSWPSSPRRSGERRPARTDGRAGLRVLDVLDAASRSLGGRRGRWSRLDRARAGGSVGVSALNGASVLVTGGAGTIGSTLVDQLLDAGVDHIDVLDNLVRGRVENLAGALESGRVTLVEGDLRDRDLVHDVTRGKDLVFHQAAIRITQCAEEPRLALEVLVDGTFTVLEAAVAAQGGQGGRGLERVGLRPGRDRSRPTSGTTTTTTTRSTARPSRSTRACCAASGRCTGWTTSACCPFNVYGPRMDVHGLYTEVLGALDGADRPTASRR